MKPLSKGHIRDNINSQALKSGCPLLRGLNCSRKTEFGGPRTVHWRVVYNTVSLSGGSTIGCFPVPSTVHGCSNLTNQIAQNEVYKSLTNLWLGL